MCNCNFRSDKEISKSFEMIASIIDKEEFDIVAMQEILSENVFKEKLARLLPAGKDYLLRKLQNAGKRTC